MKFSKIEYQKRNPNRCNMYVDEKYVFSLSINTVAKYRIIPGIEFSTPIDKILVEDLGERLYERAFKYLARSLRSKMQIANYLKKLCYEKKEDWIGEVDIDLDTLISTVIKRLERAGILDDMTYGQAYISDRMRLRPRSLSLIRSELAQKGLDREIIDELMIEFKGEDDIKLARKIIEKKYRKTTIDRSDQKAVRYLASKGFSWDVISELMENDV